MSQEKRIYVGMHDGVCSVASSDGGKTWKRVPITPLEHAAARLTSSPANPQRAYLAAYEAGVYRTDDGGSTWQRLGSYPTDYAHSVLAHPNEADTVFVGSEPAAIFRSSDGGNTWHEFGGFRSVPESTEWGFHAPTRDSHVRDLRMAPDDPNCLYAGIEVGGMVSSNDGGDSWKQLPGLDADIHCVNLSGDRPPLCKPERRPTWQCVCCHGQRTVSLRRRRTSVGADQLRPGSSVHPAHRGSS